MNYLAHSALSGTVSSFTIGNFIADHVRGRDLSHFPVDIALGIQFHRSIDQFFDNHHQVKLLRAQFPDGFRRYSGIILDMWFDHLLAINWDSFYSVTLSEFQTQVSKALRQNIDVIPDSQKRFVDYFHQERLFEKYKRRQDIARNITLMASRLKKPQHLIDCFTFFMEHPIGVSKVFERVYREMMQKAEQHNPTNLQVV
ncbi:MAG: DUF479 domain-containing protein [Gammaproteobacteria bacterium]|nr:DUF479 domain-containing protein [Gammaproteobacteria bacterium]